MYSNSALAFKIGDVKAFSKKLQIIHKYIYNGRDEVKVLNTFLYYAKRCEYGGLIVDFMYKDETDITKDDKYPLADFADVPYDVISLKGETYALSLPQATNEMLLSIYSGISNYKDYFMYTIFLLILASTYQGGPDELG